MNLHDHESISQLVIGKLRQGKHLLFRSLEELQPGNEKSENKLATLLSAFANSGGGDLIFGIKKARARAISFEGKLTGNINPEWIYNLITSLIHPAPENWNVKIVEDPGKVWQVLILSVPRYNQRPYMAPDHKFYSISAGKMHILEEGDLRRLYQLAVTPGLGFIGIINTHGIPMYNEGFPERICFWPKFLLRNHGSAPERFYKVELWIPTPLTDSNYKPLQDYFARLEGEYSVFSIPGRNPVFQGETFTIAEAKLMLEHEALTSFMSGSVRIIVYHSGGTTEHTLSLPETFTIDQKDLQTIRKSITSHPKYEN
jgi:hypothetical protein